MGGRAALNLQMIDLGESEALLFFDDTYELKVYNIAQQDMVGTLPFNSFHMKCMLIAETKLFIGLPGEIHMHDPFTMEKLAKTSTSRSATPLSMTM